jgi:hypothetical protein
MLRYDPTKPDHAKFEKKTEPKIKKKVIDVSPDKVPEVDYGKVEEKAENVIVSKETFYKVAESLKETLQKRDERNEFSLRKLFGTSDGGLSYFYIHSHNQTLYFVFNLLPFSQSYRYL